MRLGNSTFRIYSTMLAAIVLCCLIAASWFMADERLVYTLDDPYIHLAVAESILEGGYGINPGEYASPSSSILFPFLLAVGLALGFGDFTPLVFAAPFALLSVYMIAGIAATALDFDRSPNAAVFLLLGPGLVLVLNPGLPMTGMEHSIHVYSALLALAGLYRTAIQVDDRGLLPLAAGTILCVLIRFEGIALALAMIMAMLFLGYKRHALLTAFIVFAILALYAAFMTTLGLPFIPSSVMVKSAIAAQTVDGDALRLVSGLAENIYWTFSNRWGALMALSATVLAVAALFMDTLSKGHRVFFLAAAFTLIAQVAAGRFGWFGRYEVYAVAVMVFGCLALATHVQTTLWARVAIPLSLLVVAAPYLNNTLRSPAASKGIYQQQYQMHRLSQDFFPADVAVSDLGWVAYGNKNYVLDLWGLASEEARRLRKTYGWNAARLREITLNHEITYAMITDDWFQELPEEWCRIAQLVTNRVTAASDTVGIYLIKEIEEPGLRAALLALAADLPRGARIETFDCGKTP